MKVEWTDDLKIGVGIIDDQHKKLVERISNFVDAVQSNNMSDIAETINYLIGYTIQHFGAEELIMIRHGYKEFKEHRDEHSRFIKMVYDVHMGMIENRLTQEQINQFRDQLLAWIVDHIKISDKRLAEAIQN